MTSLSSSMKLGNVSTSSLVKSSQTLQTEINSYNDSAQKIIYENSAKTDADFSAYENYLQGRVTQLNGTGSITNETKSLTMSQEIVSAQKSNVSANVQRESIAIMAGGASNQDKYNSIVDGYQKLVSIGDMSGAQTLEAQAYSLSQTMQLDAQTQANAAASAAKSMSAANVTNSNNYIAGMKDAIKTINDNIAQKGMGNFNTEESSYVDALRKQGINIPKGSQASYEDVVSSIIGIADQKSASGFSKGSIMDMYHNTLQSLTPGTSEYNTVSSAITNVMNGTTKFDAYGASLTYNQVIQARDAAAAGNPLYIPQDGADGQTTFKKAQYTGVVWAKDPYGNDYQIENTTSAKAQGLSSGQKSALTAAGFQVVGSSNGATQVVVTQANQHSLNVKGTAVGTVFSVFATGQGNQFAFAANGSLYQLNVDEGGKIQLNQLQAPGASGKPTLKNVSTQAGFDQGGLKLSSSINKLPGAVSTAARGLYSGAEKTNQFLKGVQDNIGSDITKVGTAANADATKIANKVGNDATQWVKDAGVAMSGFVNGVDSLVNGGQAQQSIERATQAKINAAHELAVQNQNWMAQHYNVQVVKPQPVAQLKVASAPTNAGKIVSVGNANPLAHIDSVGNATNVGKIAGVGNASPGSLSL